jgi:hypothetical protein
MISRIYLSNLQVCVEARRLFGVLIGSVRMVTFLLRMMKSIFFVKQNNENLTVFYHLNEQLNRLIYHVCVSWYGRVIARNENMK